MSRQEKDFLGEIDVPEEVYWGINTQRALEHFQISGSVFPSAFILALAQVKKACLQANLELNVIDADIGQAILQALEELLDNHAFLDQFPIDIFQQGSATPTNMNMNEVLANRANEILGYPKGQKKPVHPNDHVNKSQSTNDVIPTAMHLAALEVIHQSLFHAIDALKEELAQKIILFEGIFKVGRTHLQDAVPLPLSMEFQVYAQQLENTEQRLKSACNDLLSLPIGGTAVGTGIDAPPGFAEICVSKLATLTNFPFVSNPVKAEGIASHIVIVQVHNILRLLASTLLKMANDIRWMGSGPYAGLGELLLPQNEPGSSIMPGKVNPTQCEMLIQVCLQIFGNDEIIANCENFGSNLDLNDCKPLMIARFLESVKLLSAGIHSFITYCLKDLQVNQARIKDQLERNPMLITHLTPIIGYDKAAEIVSIAIKTNKKIKEIILEMGLDIPDLDELLDPKNMV